VGVTGGPAASVGVTGGGSARMGFSASAPKRRTSWRMTWRMTGMMMGGRMEPSSLRWMWGGLFGKEIGFQNGASRALQLD